MSEQDDREVEVADTARRAAKAASERRKQKKNQGGDLTADDIDPAMLQRLSALLEEISAWTPGFSGSMLFHGEAATPIVSLITAGDREAMRRALTHVGSSIRHELDLIERDAVGSFVDSVTSTSRGAVLVVRLGNDLLVVSVDGKPAKIAEAWKAISDRKAELIAVTAKLISP